MHTTDCISVHVSITVIHTTHKGTGYLGPRDPHLIEFYTLHSIYTFYIYLYQKILLLGLDTFV